MTSLAAKFPALHRCLAPPAPMPAAAPCDPSGVVLGRDEAGEPLSIPLRNRLEHVFMLGSSGAGKSSGLAHYFAQSVRLGEGGLLLDPHGSLAADVLYLLRNTERTIHVIDLGASALVGFNPLELLDDFDPSAIVGMILNALNVAWDGESFSDKPSIERVLRAILYVCVELGLTFIDAMDMLERDDNGLRQYAIAHTQNEISRRDLIRLEDLARHG